MKTFFVALAYVLATQAATLPSLVGRAEFTLKNGQDAIALNEKFKTLDAGSACKDGENACVKDQFAQCVGGKFALQPCAGGTICTALPLVNSPGTSITCDTAADRDARIAATGATAAAPAPPPNNPPPANTPPPNNGGQQNNGQQNNGQQNNGQQNNGQQNNGQQNNGQQNNGQQNNAGNNGAAGNAGNAGGNVLDPAVISKNANQNGLGIDGDAGNVTPSIVSDNNFINFCKDKGQAITDGQQIEAGSCDPIIMGQIPAKDKMPSSKFQFPQNFQKIKVGDAFVIKMAIKNLDTGFFVNPKANFFNGPQQLNEQGIIKGHSHVTIEEIKNFQDTTPLNPAQKPVFFSGLNSKAVDGVLSVEVKAGTFPKPGFFRLASINTAANHQPVLSPVAQHGSLDDVVYFEITNDAGAAAPAPPTQFAQAADSMDNKPAAGAGAAKPANNKSNKDGKKGGQKAGQKRRPRSYSEAA